jgi:hypothetical protein
LPLPSGSTPFRSLGTYAVWFPRGLLLRLAAREACRELIEEWEGQGEPTAQAEVEAACARMLADSELRPEALEVRIEEAASAVLGGTAAEALTRLLATLEEQSQQAVAQDDPAGWTRQALARVREWVGSIASNDVPASGTSPNTCGEWRKSRLNWVLVGATEKLVEQWDQQLGDAAYQLMQHPGRRVAAAEAALERFVAFCNDAAATHRTRREQQAGRTENAWKHLEAALQACENEANAGGWGLPALLLFGNRSRRTLRLFMDHLAAYARQCLIEEVIAAGQLFFTRLGGRLGERLRELIFCRQRLRHLRENLESPQEEVTDLTTAHFGAGIAPPPTPVPSTDKFWESIRQSATIHVVLPDGETDLEEAAEHFMHTLTAEQRTQLDQALQDRVLAPRGGLHTACSATTDVIRSLALPLLDQAAGFLGDYLPVTDVAEVERATATAAAGQLASQVPEYLARATPLLEDGNRSQQTALLLVPASEAGRLFGEEAQRVVSELQLVRCPGQAHLMFCREQGYLPADDVQRVLRNCRPAYEEAVLAPQVSPHARFDIIDWVPLDP